VFILSFILKVFIMYNVQCVSIISYIDIISSV
jgi:hypothetical protein